MQKNIKTNMVFGVLILFCTCFVFPLCFCSSVFAYSTSISTSNSIVLDVAASGDGTSVKAESINVQSDCHAGYNLSVATPQGSNLYAGGDGTGSAIFTAVDGISALNSSNNTNKWGYTLTNNATGSTVFSPLSATQSILKTASQTASETDINDTFSIYYGAKVDSSIVPGVYRMANNGAIVYYLTMDTTCTQYTVVFNANGGTGLPDSQNIESGVSTKLASAEELTAPTGGSYTDAGNNTITGDSDKLWTFWGWNTAINGTGDWYKDREAVEDLVGAGNTITLYAQWKQATLADLVVGTPVGTEKAIDHNLMQDMSPATCWNSPITTAENAPAATLLDYRGKVVTGENLEQPEQYNVSKLADGLCWMTTNLNLGRDSGGPNGDGTITLTPDDTDISNNFTLPAGDTTSHTANTNLAKIRLTNNSGTNTNGVYYTWAAAVANTNSISYTPASSICPRNWDLPASSQYSNLGDKAGYSASNLTTAAPGSFLTNGGFTDGETFYGTGYGHLWTASSAGNNNTYGVRAENSRFLISLTTGTTYGNNKYFRKNIRCIASKGDITVNYDGNGTTEYPVTGSVASQTNVAMNTTNSQPGTGFTRDGWAFNNWNTEPDGSGVSVAPSTLLARTDFKPGDTITLYAQWIPQYTITYVNNCMTYASANASCTQAVSDGTSPQKINLDANGDGSDSLAAYNKWTLTGWKIRGWSTVADNSDYSNTEYKSGSTYSVTNQAAGDGITLYAHWVPVYSVQYDGNSADNSNGMGTINESTGIKSVRQTNVSEGDLIMLLASNFKRAGYGFAGWSTDSNAWAHFTDNDSSNDPIIYGPMETISAPAYPSNGTNITTFYAVWVPAETNNGNPVYLQDWNGCSSLTSASFNDTTGEITAGSVIALTDKRDNEVYTIAKLVDGNCWVVENLRIESAGTRGNNINDNSVTNQSLAQGYGGKFIGLANRETSTFTVNSSTNSLYKCDGSGDVYDPDAGTLQDISVSGYDGRYLYPRYDNRNTVNALSSPSYTENYGNPSSVSTSGTYKDSTVFSYGNYYSWPAAMASTETLSTASASEAAETSICPAGWHLPTGGSSNKEYNILSQGYKESDSSPSGTIMSRRYRTFPNNFLLSGYNYVSAQYRGSNGSYYTRTTAGSRGVAYSFHLTAASSMGSSNKTSGLPIRCVATTDYTVAFDANGGTGTMSNQKISVGAATNLTSNAFARNGYYFTGWNTAADGTGTFYYDEQSVNNIALPGRKLTLYAQWIECPGGYVCYIANGVNVEGTMGRQTINSTDTSITLLASNFSRTGYGFAGWSTNSAGTGTNYGPQEDVTFTAGQYLTTGFVLYAKWVASAGYLQNWNGCNSLASGAVTALTDQRDGDAYAVAKLADGNCWMIENLRLDDDAAHNSDGILAQGYGGQFAGLADSESSWNQESTTANSLYSKDGVDGTINIGNDGYLPARFPRYNNQNTASRASSPTTATEALYSYGNYYTWAAAIADTTSYEDRNIYNTTSICPSGWHIPSGGTTGDYGVLNTEVNAGSTSSDAGLRVYPNNFIRSGRLSGSRGTTGFYLSSTSNDAIYNYSLYFGNSSVSLSPTHRKANGMTLRCIVSKTIDDIDYMQDFATLGEGNKNNVINSMEEDEQYQLTDSRDDKTYYVSKLADGNVWMTQNLDLDLDSETTLTNLDTDLGWNGTSYSTASWTPDYSTITTDATDWNFYESEPESYDPGGIYWNGVAAPTDEDSCEAAGEIWDDDWWYCDVDPDDYTTSSGDLHYHLGNYYNWNAAVATNDSGDYNTWGEVVEQSICPVGWTLPLGGYYNNVKTDNKSFAYLVDHYDFDYDDTAGMLGDDIISYEEPLYLALSGCIGYSSREIGIQGHYWSATSMGGFNSFQFGSSDNGGVWPEGDDGRGYGFSVRCVAR